MVVELPLKVTQDRVRGVRFLMTLLNKVPHFVTYLHLCGESSWEHNILAHALLVLFLEVLMAQKHHHKYEASEDRGTDRDPGGSSVVI